jgi:hypothetical protein
MFYYNIRYTFIFLSYSLKYFLKRHKSYFQTAKSYIRMFKVWGHDSSGRRPVSIAKNEDINKVLISHFIYSRQYPQTIQFLINYKMDKVGVFIS